MISLINFNPADQYSRIDSPRSLLVMKQRGIAPDELICVHKDKLAIMLKKEKAM